MSTVSYTEDREARTLPCDDCGAPGGEWDIEFGQEINRPTRMVFCTPCLFGTTIKVDRELQAFVERFRRGKRHD